MARPLVLVYQDLAQPSATPVTPDLNSVIVGPAYVIKDFPDDAASILLPQAFGRLDQPAAGVDQYLPPDSSTDAVTVVSYPDNAPGAVVDRSSIRLFLQLPRVVMAATYAITDVPSLGTGATVFGTTGNENKVTFVGISDITTRGIKAGDRLIMTSSHTSPQTFLGVVSSVGEPNSSGTLTDTASLRLSANLPADGTGADQFLIGSAGSVEVRIERTVATQEFVDVAGSVITFPDAGSDKLVVKGGFSLPTTVNGTSVSRIVSYAKLYLSYRALRQDLNEPDSVSGGDILIDAVGRSYFLLGGIPSLVDARNPLATGLSLATQNAGSARVYYLGVQRNDIAGHQAARDIVDTRRDLYAFVPLTDDINVHGGYKTEWVTLADPVQADQTGTPQKFRVVLGSVPLPTATEVSPDSISGVAQQPSSSSTNLRRTLTVVGSPTVSLAQVLPNDQLVIGLVPASGSWATRRGTHLVGHVNSESELEVIPGSARWNDGATEAATGVELLIRSPQGNVKLSRLAFLELRVNATQGVRFDMLNPTVVGGPYRVQYLNVGGSSVTVAVSGFDVTLGINPTVTTTQSIVNAVNADPVLSTIMTASLVGASIAVPSSVQPTAVNVYTVFRDFADGGSTYHVKLRNPGSTPSPTLRFVNGGGTGLGAVVTVSADDVVVTYETGVSTMAQVVSALNAHPTAGALFETTLVGAGGTATLTNAATAISTVDQAAVNVAISTNDDLFLWLFDANARFLTNAVKVGDVLEFPVDPNDYSPNAYRGRVLSYAVAQVISENRLAVQNLGDDTASGAYELPHYGMRDFAGRPIDNETSSTTSALRYRVRRALSKDDQATALITIAQSLKSKRATLCWPDMVDVADLKDGSLPRVSSDVRTAAGPQPGWAIACQVAGALAGLPVQQGLTNLGLVGVNKLYHSSGYFREAQLTAISNGGLFVMHQRVPGELPFCIHQLTTDAAALETGELSVVRNFDYVSIYFQGIVEGFLGQYNVLPETLTEIQRAVIDGTERLKSRRVARIGPPLISGEVQLIKVSDFQADRVVLFFKGVIPRPLNGVDFHIVS